MPPTKLNDKVLSWAVDLDEPTRAQVEKLSRLWTLAGPVALMPDAHLGKGATIGSVIATTDVIIPSAVGVDVGCGVAGIETDLKADDLPDDLTPLRERIGTVIPAGLGKWFQKVDQSGHRWKQQEASLRWMKQHETRRVAENGLTEKGAIQLGTLGSGNHFFEVCLDERDVVWLLLHSGSRGIGNTLATIHIKKAQELAKDLHIPLEDVDLAYFTTKMPEFSEYMEDLLFAQEYALENRNAMLNAALIELFAFVAHGRVVNIINNHHNYTAREHHFGRDMWITRKGAIRAREGDKGVIPGSMGAKSYIVVGKGNPSSYMSCAHGAGRRMSRNQARKTISTDVLFRQMAGRVWLDRNARDLLDEAPDAYKDIKEVMEAQSDLVKPIHELRQILNYKGVA
jgi:tRNA-splicing ligase RtcB